MAKEAASAPVAAPAPPPAPAAPAPTNLVQRTEQVEAIIKGAMKGSTVESTEPVVRQYERQFRTDFSDPEDTGGAGRDMPSVSEIDSAMPLSEEAEAVASAKGEPAESKEERNQRGQFTRKEKPPEETEAAPAEPVAAEAEPPPAPAKPPVLDAAERRKLLANITAESERRTNEQKVHAEQQRIAAIEAKAKGSLQDRLELVFPELVGKGDAARDALIEMLVAGQVTLGPKDAAPAQPAESAAIAELRREIAELRGAAPTNPDNVASARLRHVATSMKENGVALTFADREGDAAVERALKVTKALYAMQGNTGQVDGSRVWQVVEQEYEDAFVAKYGQAAADALKGRPATPATAAVATTPAATPAAAKPQQRRPGAGRGGATVGGDPLPLDSVARRHRAIQAEIDAMEGTLRAGPR